MRATYKYDDAVLRSWTENVRNACARSKHVDRRAIKPQQPNPPSQDDASELSNRLKLIAQRFALMVTVFVLFCQEGTLKVTKHK